MLSLNNLSLAQSGIENLKNDDTFKEYGKAEFNANLKIKNIEEVKKCIADNKLDENELNKIHSYLGFESYDDFLLHIKNQNDRLKKLNEKYSFSSLNKEDVLKAFEESYDNLYIDKDYQTLLQTSNIRYGSSCYTKYKRCVTTAAAIATIEHIGCGAADLTIALGILCHSAVLTLHMNSIDDCRDAYYDCIN